MDRLIDSFCWIVLHLLGAFTFLVCLGALIVSVLALIKGGAWISFESFAGSASLFVVGLGGLSISLMITKMMW